MRNNKQITKKAPSSYARRANSGQNMRVKMRESESGIVHDSNGERKQPIVSLPEVIVSPVREIYRRFLAASGANANVTIGDLLNQFLFAISATTAYSYVSAVRIKKVRVLAPLTTQGTSVALALRPQGDDNTSNNFNAVPEQFMDTSTSIDIPAYLALRPSKDTPFGSWHQNMNVNTTGKLLTINCPPGTTLDVLFEYIERNPINTTLVPTYSYTSSGMSAGVLYASSLAGGSFLPVGVNYTL